MATKYAVIKSGGKQYRVCEGDRIRVEKLPVQVGGAVDFDEVLMLGGARTCVGTPSVPGASVATEVVAQDRARKIVVYKLKRRKNYRRKAGHRQPYTELRVTAIRDSAAVRDAAVRDAAVGDPARKSAE